MVVAVVLVAALLHAGWNGLAKAVPDRLVFSALVGLVFLTGGGVGAVLLPAPAPASWPYLATSAVLQVGYLLVLTTAYRHGEFGRVYPLARGTAPVLVTAVALTVLGERLTTGQAVGLAAVCGALGALVLLGGRPRRGDGLGLAVLTGVLIAGYTLVDGVGVRHSGTALGYAAWLFAAQGLVSPVLCRVLAGPALVPALARYAVPGVVGGVLSLVVYAAVVWAQSVANLALVSALRETSVLFAGLIGALFFGERFSPARLAVTALAVAGIVLIEIA